MAMVVFRNFSYSVSEKGHIFKKDNPSTEDRSSFLLPQWGYSKRKESATGGDGWMTFNFARVDYYPKF